MNVSAILRQYVIWGPILAIACVFGVDAAATNYRDDTIAFVKARHLNLHWETIQKTVEAYGFEGLPTPEQLGAWETLDIYMVDRSGHFATNPRFWPTAADDGLRATSDAIGSGLGGERDTRVLEDYRGSSVISSYGLVNVAGAEFVLLVEIDMAEINNVSHPWYERMDEYGVLILSLIGFMLTISHRRMKAKQRRAEEAASLEEFKAQPHVSLLDRVEYGAASVSDSDNEEG